MYIKRQLPFSKHAILSYIIIPFLFTRIFFTRVELGKPLPFISRLRIELSRGEKRLTWDSAFICAEEGLIDRLGRTFRSFSVCRFCIDFNGRFTFTFVGGLPYRIDKALTHKVIQAVLDLFMKNSGVPLYGL